MIQKYDIKLVGKSINKLKFAVKGLTKQAREAEVKEILVDKMGYDKNIEVKEMA
jgi:hypothetical protein